MGIDEDAATSVVPWRELQHEQGRLMPPPAEELLAEDHPAAVVSAFVDSLTSAAWSELGLDLRGADWRRGGVPPDGASAVQQLLHSFELFRTESRRLDQR